MKSICFLLCSLLINSLTLVIGDNNWEDPTVLMNRCKVQADASAEDVTLLLDGKMPTSHSGYCLVACLYEHAGIIKDGKFVVEQLSQLIEGSPGGSVGGEMAKQFLAEVTADCKDVENDDKCVLAMEIDMCTSKSISKHAHLHKEL